MRGTFEVDTTNVRQLARDLKESAAAMRDKADELLAALRALPVNFIPEEPPPPPPP